MPRLMKLLLLSLVMGMIALLGARPPMLLLSSFNRAARRALLRQLVRTVRLETPTWLERMVYNFGLWLGIIPVPAGGSTNFPNGLRSRGVPLPSGGLPPTGGDVFHVDSGHTDANDGNSGKNPSLPLKTIDAAVGKCAANNGDQIWVYPGHNEAVIAAAGLNLDVAGITIIFLGNDNDRGTITFGTATGADMDVGAADITMINPRFVCDLDALTGPIDVNAARFKMYNVIDEDKAAKAATDMVVADANADDLLIDGYEYRVSTTGTQKQSRIQIAAADRPTLRNIRITGDFGTGAIENGTAWIDALLENVVIDNASTTPTVGILLQATSSGVARNVHVRVASGTTPVTADNDMQWYNCWGSGVDAESGFPLGTQPYNVGAYPNAAVPADGVGLAEVLRDVWGGLMGTAAGENGVQTFPAAAVPANNVSIAEVLRDLWDAVRNGTGGAEPGANKSLVDAIGFDGAAAVTATAGMLRTMAGTVFVVKKTLTSSAVVQAGVDVTGVSSVGDILIEDVVVTADATGLAGGTALTLETNNAKGATPFFSNVITALGAQGNISLQAAATTRENTVLESGKKIVAKCTVADCTGSGTIDVYLICRRLADNATLAAA